MFAAVFRTAEFVVLVVVYGSQPSHSIRSHRLSSEQLINPTLKLTLPVQHPTAGRKKNNTGEQSSAKEPDPSPKTKEEESKEERVNRKSN